MEELRVQKTLRDAARGAVVGGAIGDALGGSTEGYPPEAIRERFGGWVTGIVGPFLEDWATHRPQSPFHKGDGHITDDTHMVLALAKIYRERRRHLDAYDMADGLVPEIADNVIWIPELERETVLQQRLFHAERYLVHRLRHANIDPREAGVGNVVNCGAAMYMAPVGIVNAGNPLRAYQEGIELAGAHQSSYGREAAGVFAAAVAEAMAPDAVVESIVQAALSVARDGTYEAVKAVTDAARTVHDWESAIPVLREAIRPYDTVGEAYRQPHPDARRPSRTKAIEELPIALGFLVSCQGNYWNTVLGGVNYGRDSDSIASMGGAIAGALQGEQALPADLARTISEASRKDFVPVADDLAQVAAEILQSDIKQARHLAERMKRAEVTLQL